MRHMSLCRRLSWADPQGQNVSRCGSVCVQPVLGLVLLFPWSGAFGLLVTLALGHLEMLPLFLCVVPGPHPCHHSHSSSGLFSLSSAAKHHLPYTHPQVCAYVVEFSGVCCFCWLGFKIGGPAALKDCKPSVGCRPGGALGSLNSQLTQGDLRHRG